MEYILDGGSKPPISTQHFNIDRKENFMKISRREYNKMVTKKKLWNKLSISHRHTTINHFRRYGSPLCGKRRCAICYGISYLRKKSLRADRQQCKIQLKKMYPSDL